jgi:ferredoxin
MGNNRTTLHLLLHFWPVGRFFNWIGRRPPFSLLFHDLFSHKNNHAIIIPINQVIQGTESIELPEKILRPLVHMASDRYVMNECLCRRAENCQNFPQEVGCLFLGQGAGKIHPSLARPVSEAGALAHIRRAVDLGLTPLIIHAAFDAYVLGIPYDQMLAICFCCDCCCTVRSGMHMGPPAFREAFERLPGLKVEVGDGCIGCGTCVPTCAHQAITLADQQAYINESCKGCAECVDVCPQDAIHLYMGDMTDVARYLEERIQSRTDIGKRGPVAQAELQG